MRKYVWTRRRGGANRRDQTAGAVWVWVLGFFGFVLIVLLVLVLLFRT